MDIYIWPSRKFCFLEFWTKKHPVLCHVINCESSGWNEKRKRLSYQLQRAAYSGGEQTTNQNCEKLLSIYVFVLQYPPLYPVLSTSWPCSSPTLIKLFLTKSGSIFCKLVTCWHLRVGPKSYYFAWKLMASTLIISLFYWTLLLWVMKWTKI